MINIPLYLNPDFHYNFSIILSLQLKHQSFVTTIIIRISLYLDIDSQYNC